MKWLIFTCWFLLAGVCLAEIQLPSSLPINSIDDVPLIKERCDKKGKPDTYDRIKQATKDTKTCLEGKINPTQIKDELEQSKKTGSMDEVFGKYCNKRPEIKECIFKTVNVSKECLDEQEIAALDNAVRIIEEVLDFACFRDGDRLAMFVAEGGLECVSSRTQKVKDCLNETLQINFSGFSLTNLPTNLPSLGIDKKKCDDIAKVQACVVNDLESNCKDTTPANIIDALFKFIKKTTCKNLKQRRSINFRKAKRSILPFQMDQLINSVPITKKIEQQCRENGGENAFSNFWNSLNHTKLCVKTKRLLITPHEEFLNHIKNCTNDFLPLMKSCLPEPAKYYPEFLLESIESLINFIYNHFNLLQVSPNNQIFYCLQRLKNTNFETKLTACPLKPEGKQLEAFAIPTKPEICQKTSSFIKCLSKIVQDTCARDIQIDNLLNELKIATDKPCLSNDNWTTINE